MSCWQGLICFALAAICNWSSAQTPAAATPAIQLLGESTGLSFSAAQSATEVWIQVKVPDGLDVKTVKVDVQSVLFDKKPDAESLKSFKARPELVTDDVPQPTLVLTVAQIDKLLPGPYAVTFRFSEAKSLPAATTKAVADVNVPPLVVVLERRAAQIAPLGKQVVDLTLGSEAAPASIRLTQQSDPRSSQLRELSVSEGAFSQADGTQVAGRLGPQLPASAAAGSDLQMTVSPTGYPVGSATGKVFIKSFDLKEPYSFEVEVRTRRHLAWLFVWVIFGLAAGHVLRVVLQSRLEKATAVNAGAQLVRAVTIEKERYPDKVFRGRIEEEERKLRDAIERKEVPAITLAVTAVNTALISARSDLVTRLQNAKDALVPAAELGRMQSPLPSEMGEALHEFGSRIELALEQVNSRDARSSDETRVNAVQRLGETLRNTNGVTLAEFRRAATGLRALKFLLNDAGETDNRPAAFTLIDDSTGLAASGELADLASVKALVAAWRDAGRRRAGGISELAGFIDEDAKALVLLAKERSVAWTPALETNATDVTAAARSISSRLDSLVRWEDLFSPSEIGASEVHEAYAGLVNQAIASHQNLPQQTTDSFNDLVRSRSYAKALELLPPAATPAPVRATLAAGHESLDTARSARQEARRKLNQQDRAIGARFGGLVGIDSLREIEAFEARSALELAALSWVQTLGVAVVLAGAAYALFGERFIGTYTELAGLFFWGFTTNLTVAKLTELSGPLAAKPKT